MEKKQHKEPITTPFSADWEDSTRGIVARALPRTNDEPTAESRHTVLSLPARAAHTHTLTQVLSTICIRADIAQVRNTTRELPRSAQGKLAHRRCKKAQTNKQTSHSLRSVWLASNDQGDICNPTDQARRQEPKKFFLLSFFFAGLAIRALAGAKRERQSRAEFFRQAAGSEDPWFRGLRFCSRRTDQRPWRGIRRRW